MHHSFEVLPQQFSFTRKFFVWLKKKKAETFISSSGVSFSVKSFWISVFVTGYKVSSCHFEATTCLWPQMMDVNCQLSKQKLFNKQDLWEALRLFFKLKYEL